MKKLTVEQEREETRQMIELSALDDERKERYLGNLNKMNRKQLAKMRIHLKQLMMIEASEETIDEMIEKKQVPEDEGAVWEIVLSKMMQKVDRVEERTRSAISGQAKRVLVK